MAEASTLWVLGRLYDLALPGPESTKVSAGATSSYTGRFDSGSGVRLEVVDRDGTLSLHVTVNGEPLPDGSGPLLMVGTDGAMFDFADPPMHMAFSRDDTGTVSWIRISGCLWQRVE